MPVNTTLNQTAISQGTSFITNAFTNTEIFGIKTIIGLIIIVLTLILITREYKQWGVLALPVLISWKIVGLQFNMLHYLVCAITFIITAMSDITIGDLLTVRQTKNKEEILQIQKPVAFDIKTRKPSKWETVKELKKIRTAKNQASGLKQKAIEALNKIKL